MSLISDGAMWKVVSERVQTVAVAGVKLDIGQYVANTRRNIEKVNHSHQ